MNFTQHLSESGKPVNRGRRKSPATLFDEVWCDLTIDFTGANCQAIFAILESEPVFITWFKANAS